MTLLRVGCVTTGHRIYFERLSVSLGHEQVKVPNVPKSAQETRQDIVNEITCTSTFVTRKGWSRKG